MPGERFYTSQRDGDWSTPSDDVIDEVLRTHRTTEFFEPSERRDLAASLRAALRDSQPDRQEGAE